MSKVKRVIERIKAIVDGKESEHAACAVCSLECCNTKPCACPPERKGIAVTDLRDVYVHVGSCLRTYAANPHVIGEKKFTDTRIN